jgi:hypothetical protein
MHRCQETCSDCISVPPCPNPDVRITCESRNRQFKSRACFNRHKTNKIGKNTVCEKRNCAIFNKFITDKRHECFKPFSTVCQHKRERLIICFMEPLKKELPRSDNVLCFTILKPHRIQSCRRMQHSTFLI